MILDLFYVPCFKLATCLDIRHSDVSLWLSMAPALSLVLLRLIVESVDLLRFALANDLASHFGALNKRCANLGRRAVHDHQNFSKAHLGARFTFELFDDNDSVLFSSKLLPTCLDNRVHDNSMRHG